MLLFFQVIPNDSKIFDIQFNEFTENYILLLNRHVIVSLTIIYIYYNNNYETEHKIKNKLSKNIINYINSDIKLKSIFNHSLRKYKIKYVIKILYSGLPFIKYINI